MEGSRGFEKNRVIKDLELPRFESLRSYCVHILTKKERREAATL